MSWARDCPYGMRILPVKIVALVKLELPLGRLLHEAGPVGLDLLVLSLNNARI